MDKINQFIVENHSTMTTKQMQERVGLSWHAVNDRLRAMGLKSCPVEKKHMTYDEIESLNTSRKYKLKLFKKYGYALDRGRKKSNTEGETLKYIKQWYLTQTVEKMAEVLNITVYTVKRHLSEQKLQGIYHDKRLKEHKVNLPKPEKPDLNRNVKIVKLKSYEGMRLVDLGYNRMSFYVPESATASEVNKLRQEKLNKMGVKIAKTG